MSKNNIQQLVDLPGVGEHYMGSYKMLQHQSSIISYLNSLDHNMMSIPFVASENAETMDEMFQGTEEQIERTNAVFLTMPRTRAKCRPLCSLCERVVA